MNEEQIRMLTEVDQRSRSNTHRIDQMQDKLEDYGEMVSTIKVLANEQGHIKDDVSSIKKTVTGLAEKPGKRWDDLVKTVIGIVVGALLALAFTHMGIG
jgi:hypothetical protein